MTGYEAEEKDEENLFLRSQEDGAAISSASIQKEDVTEIWVGWLRSSCLNILSLSFVFDIQVEKSCEQLVA